MARYIDADLLKQCVQDNITRYFTCGTGGYCLAEDVVEDIDAFPTADVVSKSEVERLTDILNSYALQYGTATDQQKIIDQAKTEVAREIIDIIEQRMRDKEDASKGHYVDFWIGVYRGVDIAYRDIKEIIEQKYTERCPDCKHFVGCECFSGKTCDEYEEERNNAK